MGQRHGRGEQQLADNRVNGPDFSGQTHYRGQFVNNQPHGRGVLSNYSNGDEYTGAFSRGRLHGYGQLKRLDQQEVHSGIFQA